MTLLSEGEEPDILPASARHQLRLDRQARVGILRNLNEPPRLPPRKAALTGKWLDLRSRRRLQRDGIDLPSLTGAVAVAEIAPGAAPAEAAAPRPAPPEDAVAARLRQSLREAPAGGAVAEAAAGEATSAPGRVRLPGDARARFAAGLVSGLIVAALCAVAAVWLLGRG